MIYFFDTEFHEDKHGIELISIGIVKANGEEYYAVNSNYDQNRASSWLKENVVNKIHPSGYGKDYYRSERQMRQEIEKFCEDMTEMWGYCAAHDWYLLNRLMGGMMNKPAYWPWNCYDIEQARAMLQIGPAKLPSYHNREDIHNALADARWAREAYAVVTA